MAEVIIFIALDRSNTSFHFEHFVCCLLNIITLLSCVYLSDNCKTKTKSESFSKLKVSLSMHILSESLYSWLIYFINQFGKQNTLQICILWFHFFLESLRLKSMNERMNKFNKVVKSVRTKVNKKIIVLACKLSATFVRTDFAAFVDLIMYRSIEVRALSLKMECMSSPAHKRALHWSFRF